MNKFLGSVLFIAVLFSCKHEPHTYDGPAVNNPPVDTNSPPTGKPCDPDSVYFQNDILPLLQANCATSGCHDAGSAQDGVILDSYANIINTADVRPGDPSGSDLYEVLIETDPNKRMPPPPASALPAAQIEIIRTWILQGAPNNYCDGCDTVDTKFSTRIEPIFAQYCQSCHGNGVQNGGVKLISHGDVTNAIMNRNLLESVKRVSGFKAMPPGGPIPDCDVRAIELWINEGMPNN